jgi:alkaline phosphatase D
MRRRDFLRRALAAPAAYGGLRALDGAPAILRADSERPAAPYGAAVGDVVPGRAMVWSRADRPARLVVEWDTTDAFRNIRRVVGPAASPDTGLTARVDLTGLPAGQRIAYRVLFQDLADARVSSLPVTGTFRTPAAAPADVTLAWSADTVGQGWGINPEWGGLKLYETMRRATPDVFIHVGDTIYGDQPLLPEVTLDDGTVWKNIVTPAKSKPAESLDDFRGNHLYNLTDENARRFYAEVPLVALWDDHEVLDNWYPTEILPETDRHAEKRVAVLAAHAKQAFYEHYPIRATPQESQRVYRSIPYGPSVEIFALDMRTYRGANSPNRQPALGPESAILGEAQRAWLKSMGMFARVGIELPEAGIPIIQPASAWKQVVTLTVAFGHGISVSPMHVVRGTAAVTLERRRWSWLDVSLASAIALAITIVLLPAIYQSRLHAQYFPHTRESRREIQDQEHVLGPGSDFDADANAACEDRRHLFGQADVLRRLADRGGNAEDGASDLHQSGSAT